eukprot:457751-Prymnesium_polylepis.2
MCGALAGGSRWNPGNARLARHLKAALGAQQQRQCRIAVHAAQLVPSGRERAEEARLVEEARQCAVLWPLGESGEVPEALVDSAALLVERLEMILQRLALDQLAHAPIDVRRQAL